MNKLIRKVTPVLGVAGLALTAISAHAQFTYHTGDLLLDFSESGYSDLEVDIGSLSSLTAAAQSAGGTVQISQYSPSAQLLSNFGNSASGVTFTVIGAAGTVNADDYLTLARLNPDTQNTAPSGWTASKGNSILSQISSIGTAANTYASGIAADPVANTPTAVLVPTSSAVSAQYIDSFTHHLSGLTGLTGVNIGNTLSSSSVVSDLFDYPEHNTSQAAFDGFFTFNSDGSLDFTGVSIPEPGTYGFLAAGGLLIVALRRQSKPQVL